MINFDISKENDLFKAIDRGDLDSTKGLLEAHPEWIARNSKTGLCVSPFELAAFQNRKDILDFLIFFAQITPLVTDITYGIHYAALNGHTKLVQYLIQTHQRSNTIEDGVGRTIAHYAALGGQVDTFVYAVETLGNSITQKDYFGNTALHLLAESGEVNALEELMAKYPSLNDLVNSPNNKQLTPAHIAAMRGHTCVLKLLHEGAHLDLKDCDGETPLFKAAFGGHLSTVQYLVAMGCDTKLVNSENGMSVLGKAVCGGSIPVVDYFLQTCRLNPLVTTTEEGYGLVHLAALHGQRDMFVHLTKEYGLDARGVSAKEQKTALHLAARGGHVDMMLTLIETYRISPDAQDAAQKLPIHEALSWGRFAAVHVLLAHYASPSGITHYETLDTYLHLTEDKHLKKLLKSALRFFRSLDRKESLDDTLDAYSYHGKDKDKSRHPLYCLSKYPNIAGEAGFILTFLSMAGIDDAKLFIRWPLLNGSTLIQYALKTGNAQFIKDMADIFGNDFLMSLSMSHKNSKEADILCLAKALAGDEDAKCRVFRSQSLCDHLLRSVEEKHFHHEEAKVLLLEGLRGNYYQADMSDINHPLVFLHDENAKPSYDTQQLIFLYAKELGDYETTCIYAGLLSSNALGLKRLYEPSEDDTVLLLQTFQQLKKAKEENEALLEGIRNITQSIREMRLEVTSLNAPPQTHPTPTTPETSPPLYRKK